MTDDYLYELAFENQTIRMESQGSYVLYKNSDDRKVYVDADGKTRNVSGTNEAVSCKGQKHGPNGAPYVVTVEEPGVVSVRVFNVDNPVFINQKLINDAPNGVRVEARESRIPVQIGDMEGKQSFRFHITNRESKQDPVVPEEEVDEGLSFTTEKEVSEESSGFIKPAPSNDYRPPADTNDVQKVCMSILLDYWDECDKMRAESHIGQMVASSEIAYGKPSHSELVSIYEREAELLMQFLDKNYDSFPDDYSELRHLLVDAVKLGLSGYIQGPSSSPTVIELSCDYQTEYDTYGRPTHELANYSIDARVVEEATKVVDEWNGM